MPAQTPWGWSQYSEEIADGITFYGTASHGGIRLSKKRLNQLPDYMRHANSDGWFEEDCDWAIPAVFYAEEFAAHEARKAKEVFDEKVRAGELPRGAPDSYARACVSEQAERACDTLRNWRPEIYERFFGATLQPGQSFVRDEQLFKQQHRDDWVAISVWSQGTPGVPAGMFRVAATRGGERTPRAEERSFLVPCADYEKRGPHGFVIDPTRHQQFEAEGPDSLPAPRRRDGDKHQAATASRRIMLTDGTRADILRQRNGLALVSYENRFALAHVASGRTLPLSRELPNRKAASHVFDYVCRAFDWSKPESEAAAWVSSAEGAKRLAELVEKGRSDALARDQWPVRFPANFAAMVLERLGASAAADNVRAGVINAHDYKYNCGCCRTYIVAPGLCLAFEDSEQLVPCAQAAHQEIASIIKRGDLAAAVALLTGEKPNDTRPGPILLRYEAEARRIIAARETSQDIDEPNPAPGM